MEALLKFLEEKTTLMEDLQLMSEPDLSFQKRMVLIYRSERKRIVHS